MSVIRLSSTTARYRLLWLLWLFGCAACVCPFNRFESQLTRTKPTQAAMSGTYVLSHQTLTSTPLNELTDQNGMPFPGSTIILHVDGTVEALTVPRWVRNEEVGNNDLYAIDAFVSGEGRWAIAGGDVGWRLILADTELNLGKHLWIDGVGPRIGLGGQQPPYQLIFFRYHPDPDSTQAMYYTQQPSPGLSKLSPRSRSLAVTAIRGFTAVSPQARWVLFWIEISPSLSIGFGVLALAFWALRSYRRVP